MKKNQHIKFRSDFSKFTGEGKYLGKKGKSLIIELTSDFKEFKKGQNILISEDEVINDSKVENSRQTITNDSIILQFSDDVGTIHEVGLNSILNGGYPLDEESEEPMEYLQTFILK